MQRSELKYFEFIYLFPRGFYDKVFSVSERRHSLTGYDR